MAVFFIALYGLTYALSRRLSQACGVPLTGAAMLAYVLLLLFALKKSGRCASLRLRRPARMRRVALLGLLAFPAYNLLCASGSAPRLDDALLMIAVAAAEEICFRGALLSACLRFGERPAALLSALAFSLAHAVNLVGQAPGFVAMQMVCALAAGVCCAGATLYTGSLLPAIAAHALTNVTGLGGASAHAPGLLSCAAVCAVCGARLLSQERTNEKGTGLCRFLRF